MLSFVNALFLFGASFVLYLIPYGDWHGIV